MSGQARRPALELRGVAVDYGWGQRAAHAVVGVDLELGRGEVLGLVGESGSGKSTLAYAAARLLRPPGRLVAGQVLYHPPQGHPVEITSMDDEALRRWRWDRLAIVPQASMNALNPVTSLKSQLTDALAAHRPSMDPSAREARAAECLELVGIPANRLSSYAHQLSGGMRQRAVIAMALVLDPEIVIMDEPTTALDVVVQREILSRLTQLTQELSLSLIFITHDLSLLLEIADSIAVMYAGRIVEKAGAEELASRPLHPYTRGLLGSFPSLVGPRVPLHGIPGSPPDPRAFPSGCPFHPRCAEAFDRCPEHDPPLVPFGAGAVACWAREREREGAAGEETRVGRVS